MYFCPTGSEATDVVFYLEGCTDPPCVMIKGEAYFSNLTFTSGE